VLCAQNLSNPNGNLARSCPERYEKNQCFRTVGLPDHNACQQTLRSIHHHVDAFTTDVFASCSFGTNIIEDLHLCNQCWESGKHGQSAFPCCFCKFCNRRVVGMLSSQILIRITHYPFLQHTGGWFTRKMRADTKIGSIEADYRGKPLACHETGLHLVISLWACLELCAGNVLYQLVRGEHSTSNLGVLIEVQCSQFHSCVYSRKNQWRYPQHYDCFCGMDADHFTWSYLNILRLDWWFAFGRVLAPRPAFLHGRIPGFGSPLCDGRGKKKRPGRVTACNQITSTPNRWLVFPDWESSWDLLPFFSWRKPCVSLVGVKKVKIQPTHIPTPTQHLRQVRPRA